MSSVLYKRPKSIFKGRINYPYKKLILEEELYRDFALRRNPAIGEVNPEYLAASDLEHEILYIRKKIKISVLDTNFNGHLDKDSSTKRLAKPKKYSGIVFQKKIVADCLL